MQQTKSSKASPKRKRRILRSCLTVILGYLVAGIVVVSLSGGCCMSLVHRNDPRESRIDRRVIDFSPEEREIVYSSRLETIRPPLIGFNPRISYGPEFSKRIPLDPIPEGMFLVTLVVESDPSYPHPDLFPGISIYSRWPRFLHPLRSLDENGEVVTDPYQGLFPFDASATRPAMITSLRPGGTYLLRVHPDDLASLSMPYFVYLETRNRQNPDIGRSILVFPYAGEGNRRTVLTSGGDVFPEPFEEEFYAIAKRETEPEKEVSSLDKWLFVGAFFVDLVFLPVEVPFLIVKGICSLSTTDKRPMNPAENNTGSEVKR